VFRSRCNNGHEMRLSYFRAQFTRSLSHRSSHRGPDLHSRVVVESRVSVHYSTYAIDVLRFNTNYVLILDILFVIKFNIIRVLYYYYDA
jgi:hypothetical protein